MLSRVFLLIIKNNVLLHFGAVQRKFAGPNQLSSWPFDIFFLFNICFSTTNFLSNLICIKWPWYNLTVMQSNVIVQSLIIVSLIYIYIYIYIYMHKYTHIFLTSTKYHCLQLLLRYFTAMSIHAIFSQRIHNIWSFNFCSCHCNIHWQLKLT